MYCTHYFRVESGAAAGLPEPDGATAGVPYGATCYTTEVSMASQKQTLSMVAHVQQYKKVLLRNGNQTSITQQITVSQF